MKAKILGIVLAMLTVVSGAFAFTPTFGGEAGVTMETEDFVPLIWLHEDGCKVYRNLADQQEGSDNWVDGDYTDLLVERIENYAFEGEYIKCPVLVMDKNGIEKIADVWGGLSGLGPTSGQEADEFGTDFSIEVNCDEGATHYAGDIDDYNARIGEEWLHDFDSDTMQFYTCIFTVETANSMYGEYFLGFLVEDLDGQFNSIDENQFWFFNPMVGITVYGDIDFGIVRPGTMSYSDTLLIENTADAGSGVLLDMAISGSDFYDPDSTGAKCPVSNVLNLDRFAYYASNGAYHTVEGVGRDPWPIGRNEGYNTIPYEVADPSARAPIIEGMGELEMELDSPTLPPFLEGEREFHAGNVLSPGAEIAITFRLFLPEPCNGDFTDGAIYFWGTAI